MKIYSKNILILIIVFLVATNTATIGTIIYNAYFQTNDNKENTKKTKTVENKCFCKHCRNELSLNNEQYIKFDSSKQKFQRHAKFLKNEMHINRNKFIRELGKDKSDTIYLRKLSEEIGKLHTELKHFTFEYYIEMKNVCTDEQKEKLFDMFKIMINKDVEMPIHKKRLKRKRNRKKLWRQESFLDQNVIDCNN